MQNFPIGVAVISPDGKTVLTARTLNGGYFNLWASVAEERVRWVQPPHADEVMAAAFSPDGKTVLTGSRDRTARFWETATGRQTDRPSSIEIQSMRWPSAPMAIPC